MSTVEMSFDQATEDAKNELQGGELKLDPGQSMTVVFLRSLPVMKEAIHFIVNSEGKKEPQDCEGDPCRWCTRAAQTGNRDERRNVTYRLPVWRVSDRGNATAVEYWKVSRTVMKDVGAMLSRYHSTYVFEVQRQGAGRDTEYKLYPGVQLAEKDMPAYEAVLAGQGQPQGSQSSVTDEQDEVGF